MFEVIKNFSQHFIKQNTSILDAMKKMNLLNNNDISDSNFKFLILLDDADRLLGTVTDGDIRRSILSGKSLNSSIKEAACLKPYAGVVNEQNKNKEILKKLKEETNFLPILDHKKKVDSILILNNKLSRKTVSVLLMAGGFGKRLGEKTKKTPKPLIKKNGKPLINYVFDSIKKSNYISNVFVSTHYLSNKIKDHINNLNFKLPIEILYEEKPLGTAGIISVIDKEKMKDDLLVINSDLITNLDLDDLINYHNFSINDITIAVAKYTISVPYGVIEYTSEGVFKKIIEKPDIGKYVSAGIYILSKNIKELLPNQKRIDMPELINKGIEKGYNVGVFPIHENWSDIGRPEDL